MRACVLRSPIRVESSPLDYTEVSLPEPGVGEVRVRVAACGVCRTELHVVEGELPSQKLPVIPGHQVVGVIDQLGKGVTHLEPGMRVGIAWLHRTCGSCE